MSRTISMKDFKILIIDENEEDIYETGNMIYKEVYDNIVQGKKDFWI
jgi:hypothetical protein